MDFAHLFLHLYLLFFLFLFDNVSENFKRIKLLDLFFPCEARVLKFWLFGTRGGGECEVGSGTYVSG